MKFNVKVFNKETRRVDFHKDLSREEISWISSNPNLHVEILSEDVRLSEEDSED